MKHFKLVHVDATVDELEVDRVVRDNDTLYADSRVEGQWTNVLRIDVDEIDEVRRRITDFNGERRWIRHRASYLPDRFDVDRSEAPVPSVPGDSQ